MTQTRELRIQQTIGIANEIAGPDTCGYDSHFYYDQLRAIAYFAAWDALEAGKSVTEATRAAICASGKLW